MNLNDRVKFKLTEYGKELLADSIKKDNELIEHVLGHEKANKTLPTPDINGEYSMQLWELFPIFGNKIHQGLKQIFINNELRIIYEKQGEFSHDRI